MGEPAADDDDEEIQLMHCTQRAVNNTSILYVMIMTSAAAQSETDCGGRDALALEKVTLIDQVVGGCEEND